MRKTKINLLKSTIVRFRFLAAREQKISECGTVRDASSDAKPRLRLLQFWGSQTDAKRKLK